MCADAHLPANEHSDLIIELPASYARLARNQTHPGYAVVILKRHVCELHDLTPLALGAFWTDVARVGAAIDDLFAPMKLDSLVMGHQCPHLHCHIYPQYADDDPAALIDISAGDVRLTVTQQRERVELIRARILAGAAPRSG